MALDLSFLGFIDFPLLIKIIEVVATFAGAWLINKYIVKPTIHRSLDHLDLHTRLIVIRIFGIVVYIFAIIITFSILELTGPATALLGSLGIAGIVIGLAVKDFVSDILSGFLVYTDQPFKIGDSIELDGRFGKVKDITSRVTRIETYNGELITIPNSKIRGMTIINKTLTGPLLRTIIPIGIDYDADVEKALEICDNVIKKHPGVEEKPAPLVLVKNLGDSSVNLEMRYWVNIKKNSRLRVKSDIIVQTKKALEKAKINIPFPQVTVSRRR